MSFKRCALIVLRSLTKWDNLAVHTLTLLPHPLSGLTIFISEEIHFVSLLHKWDAMIAHTSKVGCNLAQRSIHKQHGLPADFFDFLDTFVILPHAVPIKALSWIFICSTLRNSWSALYLLVLDSRICSPCRCHRYLHSQDICIQILASIYQEIKQS